MRTWDDFVADADKKYGTSEPDELSKASSLILKAVVRRLELGWTQSALASKAGLQQAAIARLESFTVIPRLNTLIKVFNALGLELEVGSKLENSQTLDVSIRVGYDFGHIEAVSSEVLECPVVDGATSVEIQVSPEELFLWKSNPSLMGVAA